MTEHDAEREAPRWQPPHTSAVIDSALTAFVNGFCFTRSLTHPYVGQRVGPLWALRDAPRKSGSYRCEEWIGYGVPPDEIDRIVRAHAQGRFRLCVLLGAGEPETALRKAFKALHYRLGRTESLMTHDLARIPRFESPAAMRRVTSMEEADDLAKASGSRQLLPEHLSPDSPLRAYVARIGDELVGWARSSVINGSGWCSSVFVKPPFRRRGIARALLCRMLHDDRAAGAKESVLLATHAGAKLYPVVGYQEIGTLFVYTPKAAGG